MNETQTSGRDSQGEGFVQLLNFANTCATEKLMQARLCKAFQFSVAWCGESIESIR